MKKGQVTIYIIIGIVILAVIVAVFAFRSQLLASTFNRQQQNLNLLPIEIRPVKENINSCVYETAKQGIILVGQQGGYYNIPKDELPRSIINPFSNSLEILRGDEVAYWYYTTSNGIEKITIPSKEDIEKEIQYYINDNLQDCLENLTNFEDNGYEINEDGIVESKVTIGPENVDVDVKYDVEVNYKGVSRKLDEHFAKIDVRLGMIYDAARDIVDEELKNSFFENKTLNYLTIYDEIPYYGQSLDCSPKVWFKEDVDNNIKNVLKYNLDGIKVKGSNNQNFDQFYDWDVNGNFNSFDVNFRYDERWPLETKINGGENILKEDSLTGSNIAVKTILSIFCLNNYQFIYAIKYPMLTSLTDNNAFDNEGFIFQYANQVVIEKNQARKNNYDLESLKDTSIRICENKQYKTLVRILDDESGNELDGNVKFGCGGAICDYGGERDIRLPPCINAEIIGTSEGYADNSVIANTNGEGEITIDLKRKYELNLKIKIIDNGIIRDLRNDENYATQFINEEDGYATSSSKENNNLELIKGDYFIKAYLLRNVNDLELQNKTVEYCTDVPKGGIFGLIGLKSKKCFKSEIAGFKLSQAIVGGEEFPFTVGNEINNANEIIIYLVMNKVPATLDDLQQIYDLIRRNKDNSDFRYPEMR